MLGLERPRICCCTLSGAPPICKAVSAERRKERHVNDGIFRLSASGLNTRFVTSCALKKLPGRSF